jgi:hypothetical protein
MKNKISIVIQFQHNGNTNKIHIMRKKKMKPINYQLLPHETLIQFVTKTPALGHPIFLIQEHRMHKSFQKNYLEH